MEMLPLLREIAETWPTVTIDDDVSPTPTATLSAACARAVRRTSHFASCGKNDGGG